MYDLSAQLQKFHEGRVRLTRQQQADMRARRQLNLDRIEKGLQELGKPTLAETISQGGYAQKTMTQPPEADQTSRYDIDLGVVFEGDDAAGPRTTRGWVRDAIALKATNMANQPETKKKCIRVVYADGYQCDFPVFRRSWTEAGWRYELSAGEEWIPSDPSAMNAWINDQVSAKSPEKSGSHQLRRMIRLGKFFGKTHSNRTSRKFPSGLVATALIIESYVPVDGRDDQSFRETLRAISSRSRYNPVIANGVQVSDDKDIERIGRLIDEAGDCVVELDRLDGDNTRDFDAYKAWKKVFRHSFFEVSADQTSQAETVRSRSSAIVGTAGIAAPSLASEAAAALSDGERASRMEAAVRARRESGDGSKPWSR